MCIRDRYKHPPIYKLMFFNIEKRLSDADAFFKKNEAMAPLSVIITSIK